MSLDAKFVSGIEVYDVLVDDLLNELHIGPLKDVRSVEASIAPDMIESSRAVLRLRVHFDER